PMSGKQKADPHPRRSRYIASAGRPPLIDAGAERRNRVSKTDISGRRSARFPIEQRPDYARQRAGEVASRAVVRERIQHVKAQHVLFVDLIDAHRLPGSDERFYRVRIDLEQVARYPHPDQMPSRGPVLLLKHRILRIDRREDLSTIPVLHPVQHQNAVSRLENIDLELDAERLAYVDAIGDDP